jgi:hypothetical protein
MPTKINELSRAVLQRYADKAKRNLKDTDVSKMHMWPSKLHKGSRSRVVTDPSKNDAMLKRVSNRATGIRRAEKRLEKKDAERNDQQLVAYRQKKKASKDGVHDSDSFRMRHYPGNPESDQELADLKAVMNPGQRIDRRGRLGKDSPHAHHYRVGGALSKANWIKPQHAAHFDIYVRDRTQHEETRVDEATKTPETAAWVIRHTHGGKKGVTTYHMALPQDARKAFKKQFPKSQVAWMLPKHIFDKMHPTVSESAEVNEVSKSKLLNYISAASIDKSFHASDIGRINLIATRDGTDERERKDRETANKKHGNRSSGIQLAAAKLAGPHKLDKLTKPRPYHAISPATESVDESKRTPADLEKIARHHDSRRNAHSLASLAHLRLSARALELARDKDENHHSIMHDRHERAARTHERAADVARSIMWRIKNTNRPAVETITKNPSHATPLRTEAKQPDQTSVIYGFKAKHTLKDIAKNGHRKNPALIKKLQARVDRGITKKLMNKA